MIKSKIIFSIFVSFTTVFFSIPTGLDALNSLPEKHLAIPVLILVDVTPDGQKTGSGFYYCSDNNYYFVTARHVIFKNASVPLIQGTNIPPNMFHKFSIDNATKELVFDGEMTTTEKDALIKLQPDQVRKDNMELLFAKSKKLTLIGKTATLLSYYAPIKDPQSVDEIEVALNKLYQNNKIKYHPNSDIAVIKIGTYSDQKDYVDIYFFNEAKIVKRSKSSIKSIGSEKIKFFKDISASNEVFIFGYPTNITNGTNQLDIRKPLLRKGIIAGKNDVLKTIILDCPVYGGQSGGLVIEVSKVGINDKFLAIGIITQFVGFKLGKNILENTGYSVAVPLDELDDLIASFNNTKK